MSFPRTRECKMRDVVGYINLRKTNLLGIYHRHKGSGGSPGWGIEIRGRRSEVRGHRAQTIGAIYTQACMNTNAFLFDSHLFLKLPVKSYTKCWSLRPLPAGFPHSQEWHPTFAEMTHGAGKNEHTSLLWNERGLRAYLLKNKFAFSRFGIKLLWILLNPSPEYAFYELYFKCYPPKHSGGLN